MVQKEYLKIMPLVAALQIAICCLCKTQQIIAQKNLISLRPESSKNIPILLQEADPDFSNQNDLRNPKMDSKQSVTGAPEQ